MPNFFASRSLLIIPLLVFIAVLLRSNNLSIGSIISQGFQDLLFEDKNNYDWIINDLCMTIPQETLAENENKLSQNIVERMRGSNPLVKIISERDPTNMTVRENQDSIIQEYERTMTPVLILAGIALFLALFCSFRIFCTSKKDHHIKRLGVQKEYLVGFNLILLISLIFLGFSGLSLSGLIEKNANSVLCAWHKSLIDTRNGSGDRNWLGLLHLTFVVGSKNHSLTFITQISDRLRNMPMNSSSPFSDSIIKLAEPTFLSMQNLSRGNPEIKGSYFPDLLLSSLRLSQPTQTDVQRILNELNDHHMDFQKNVFTVLGHLDSFLQNTQDLLKALDLELQPINKSFEELESLRFFTQEYSQTIKILSQRSQLLLKLTFILLSAVSSISLLCLKFKMRIARFLKMGWWLLFGLLIFSWIISLIILPMNVRFMEICGVLEESLEDPIFFNKTMDLFTGPSSNASQCLYTCLHGSADISLALGLSELIPKKFPQLESYDWFEGLRKRPSIPSEISLFYQKLDDFRTGTLSDSHETNADLEKLNSLTMIETGCGVIKDTWVLNSVNCTDNMGEKFVSRSPSDWNMGKPTCIGIFEWMAGNRNVAERYASKDCLDEESRKKMRLAREFVEEFIQNRKELEGLLEKIQAGMEAEVSKAELEYVEKLWDFSEFAYRMGNLLIAFRKDLFAPETGFLSKMKCDIIKEDIQDFEKSFCRNFVPTVFDIFSMITLVLVISIVTVWSLFFVLRSELDEDKVDERGKESRREDSEKKID